MNIVIPLYFFVVAILVGLAIPVLGVKFGILVFGVFFAPALLFIPAELILFATLTLGLLVVGVLTYFANIGVYWSVYISGLIGYFICLLSATRSVSKSSSKFSGTNNSTHILFFFLFIACLAVSTAITRPAPYSLLFAVRDYFFLMSAYLIVVRSQLSDKFLRRLWNFLFFCALVQLPITVYQFLFVARNRPDLAKWDAVVGTFTGTQSGGGDSGGLALFLFSVLVLAIELRKSGAVTKHHLLAIVLTIITFIMISEVKVAFILLSIIAVWNLVANNKISFISRLAMFAGLLGVVIGLTWFYGEYRQDKSNKSLTEEKQLERTLVFSVDPTKVDQGYIVGRVASIVFWGKLNSFERDPVSFLIGNGAGSMTSSREGLGVVAKKYYPLRMDANAAAVLLWDTGLIGAISYGLFVLLILRKAIASRNDETSSIWLRGYLAAMPQILFFYFISLFYNKGMIAASPPTQLIFFIFAGLASRWSFQKQKSVAQG